ncbi:MAG: hypothetical protein WCT04_23805 [Planctomycetota bacterium]
MDETIALATDAAALLEGTHADVAANLSQAAQRLAARDFRVLVSGLCSVGKSSFVSALWGDSDLLPTAVRDCTQTNTLIRVPRSDEADRRIVLKWLGRDAAILFALKGLACHRLTEMLEAIHGVELPRLDEMTPENRVRYVAGEARRLYSTRPDLQVLYEPLTDEMEQLENYLEFIDSSEYQPGAEVEASWDERRENLMGRRREDGRLAGTGRLMALEHVEVVRETGWHPGHGLGAPVVVDTPWIPALHNARREDLILNQASRADVLMVLSLPQRYECESWLLKLLRKRPELAKTTVFVFNQIDTCDPRTLFSRDGFSGIYEDNRERLLKLGFDPANMLASCARMRFLQNALKSEAESVGHVQASPFGASGLPERIARLEKVLAAMREQARSRPDGELKTKLLPACDSTDAGVETVRRRVEELTRTLVLPRRRSALLRQIADSDASDLPLEKRAAWAAIHKQAIAKLMAL